MKYLHTSYIESIFTVDRRRHLQTCHCHQHRAYGTMHTVALQVIVLDSLAQIAAGYATAKSHMSRGYRNLHACVLVCACVRPTSTNVKKTHAYIKMQLRVQRHIIHIDIYAIYVHVDNHM